MEWINFLEQVLELVVYPILGVIGTYLTYLIQLKIKEVKQKADNEKADKYFNMLENTISTVVMATSQTYVDSLKAQGNFNTEAQKVALKLTYDTVVGLLTDEAQEYLATCVADLETYIINKIEANIKLYK